MLKDFDLLGVRSVAQLAQCEGDELYHRLCAITHSRMDPCVHDTLVCAVEQARNPDLPAEKCDWWFWSRVRKQSGIKL